jgi:hypothetical protein
MRIKALLSIVMILLTCDSIQAQEWSKYVPEKQRKAIYKKSIKTGGVGLTLTGQAVGVVWVTDQIARAMVSYAVDRERLTVEEAETRYRKLRPENGYLILVNAIRLGGSPLGVVAASKLDNPLAPNETFLQREDDRKKFSRGEVADHQADVYLAGFGGPNFTSAYMVVFPRNDRAGEPIIKGLEDKIEVQFTLSNKKVVLDYKIKDLVARLEDL